MIFALLACTAPAPEGSATSGETSARLRADGTRIVDGAGETVILRGVALGGWNFHENWITGVDYPAHARLHVIGQEAGFGDDVDAVLRAVGPNEDGDVAWLAAVSAGLTERLGVETSESLLATLATYPSVVDDSDRALRIALETRFGTDGRDRLLDTFQGAWVTQADLDWIAAQGMNTVRVPLGYRGLTRGSDLAPLTELVWNEAAFARIDALLDGCEAAGLYAVLDMQEAPGGQNAYAGESTLYADPAMQALTVDLWEELSRRYADRDSVAAYSLLAEPMRAPDDAARDAVYDQLVRAIRARGDDHLLVIHDGFQGMGTLPVPTSVGWDGVVYSTHLFEWGAQNLNDYEAVVALYGTVFAVAQAEQDVPYYIGSFSTFVDADWAYDGAERMVEWYEDAGYGWTLWTYKRIDDPVDIALFGTETAWGLRGRLTTPFDRPDVYRDDEATLNAKLAAYAEMGLEANPALLAALQGGMPAR